MTSIDTGSEIADSYLEQASGTTLTKGSASRYANNIRQFNSYLSEVDSCLLEAESPQVMGFFRQRAQRKDRKNTLQSKRSAIKGAYRYVVLETDYEPNIRLAEIDAIDLSKFNTPPPITRESLTRDELSVLIDAMDSRRDELMTFTTLAAGIRNSETLNLKLADFNPKEQTLWIAAPKGYESHENTEPYYQPIPPILTRRLQHWIQVGRDTVTPDPGPYLFPSQEGGKLGSERFTNLVREAGFEAGIQSNLGEITEWTRNGRSVKTAHRVIPHALKHSFVTVLESEGVDRVTQSEAANHNNPDTTDRYRHLEDTGLNVLRDIFNIDF